MDNYNIIVNDAPSYNIVFNQPEEQYTIVLENEQGANGATTVEAIGGHGIIVTLAGAQSTMV